MQNIKKEGFQMSSELDFDPVQDEDIEDIRSYLALCEYEESNHNLVNLFQWIPWYPLFKFKTEHYYLLLGIHQGEFFLYMPLCKSEYVEEAILKGKEIFDEHQFPFVLSCFTKEMMERVLRLFPEYQACPAPESYDYVYLCEKLISFSGKKLQKKRNHLNAFYQQYQGRYGYESIDENNIQECMDFLAKWKLDEEDEALVFDRIGTQRVLERYFKLGCKGGLIRIDQEVKAFAIGSHLSSSMCQENIEKADDSIRGLYQAMIKEWLSHEFSEYEYCNREDDMGKENLRQAKQAYAPIKMIEKYRLCKGVKP